MIGDPLPPKSVRPREANVMYYRRQVCNILRDFALNQEVTAENCYPEKTDEKDMKKDLIISDHKLERNVKNIEDYNNENVTEGKEEMKQDNDIVEKRKGCKKPHQFMPQFTYSLWTFGSLNILIRTTCCGLLHHPENKADKDSLHSASVFVKPEYQLSYGYEQITTSESARWWVNTYINPDSLCICARIDPVTAKMLRVDFLNHSNILILSSFDPAKSMKMVHGVLTRLGKLLSSGRYLLSHTAKHMHICVYEEMTIQDKMEKPVKAAYDLQLSHSKKVLTEYDESVPWVPIDPNIFLDWHIAHHRIPLTFPPISKDELKKDRKVNFTKQKTKKGKKAKHHKAKATLHKALNIESNLQAKPSELTKKLTEGAEQEVEENMGIAQRLRSRGRPLTYDDIDFDF